MEKHPIGKIVPISDNKNYHRDLSTGAVILNDQETLNKYKLQREKKLAELRKMKELQDQVDDLKNNISNLTEMVRELQKNSKTN